MNVAVVIAAYNEESHIAKTIASIPRAITGVNGVDVVVINDGSKDQTAQEAKKAGAIVLSHSLNRGQGAALETGFEFVRRKGYDAVVTFDADGQHKGSEIEKMLDPILKGETEVALGSRFLTSKRESNVSFSRKAILKAGVLFTKVISRLHITDTHNGFRAFSAQALQQIRLRQDRMEHASEILELIARHNISYKEIPVVITYTDYSRKKGQRNSNALRIAWRMLLYKLERGR